MPYETKERAVSESDVGRSLQRAVSPRAEVCPRVSREHDERQADQDEKRWQQTDDGGGVVPPDRQDGPRQHAADNRQERQAS